MPQGSYLPDIQELRAHFDNLVQVTNTASASTTLNNGDAATFSMTSSSMAGGILNAETDVTLYLGSVSAANAFPDGANITMSQWQIMGPFTDWGAVNAGKNNVVTKIFIRNISAGTQTVLFRGWARTIINSLSNLGSS